MPQLEPNIPTKEELNPQPKKDRLGWIIFKKIALFVLPLVAKNWKGVKGTKNEKLVDDIKNVLDEL